MSRLPEPLDAVVFDLDGTLVDSAGDLAEAVDRMLAELGLPPVGVAAVTRMIGDGARMTLERAFARVGHTPTPEGFEAAMARFLDIYEHELGDSTRLYPGAEACLAALRARGVRLGLCTNKPSTPTRQLLERLGLPKTFGAVVGGGDTPELKPHPLPLLTTLERLGARPDRALYVGDSRTDLETARKAGVAIALIPSGYGQHPVAAEEGDIAVEDLAALAELLAEA
jgi:phosphoglycolate phosphatase